MKIKIPIGLCPYLAIFALALGLRAVYIVQLEDAPIFSSLMADARGYDLWAQEIAAGNWLGNQVFYQAPLYPYFLGATYAILGHDLFLARFMQIVIGAVSCVLLALAGQSFFSKRVGFLCGVLLAVYPPAIFFDGLLQKSVMDMLFMTVLLVLLGKLLEGGSKWLWGLVGVALGGFALTRENALILFPAISIWMLVRFRHGYWNTRCTCGVLFLAGMAITLFPVGLRNKVVGGEFFLTTSQLGPNFYIGNHDGADGQYEALRWGRGTPEVERQDATELAEAALGLKLTPREVSSYWLGEGMRFIRQHPWQWTQLMVRKWFLTWNAIELADSEDIGTYAEYASLLKRLNGFLHFGVLFPLAALGIFVTWRSRDKLWLLYLMLLSLTSAVALFFVFARYRYPLVPLLVMFAAAGLMKSFALWRGRQFKSLLGGLACMLVAAIASNWPIIPNYNPRAHTHYNIGCALELQGKPEEAIAHYREALRIQPDHERAHYNLGLSLAGQGKTGEAAAHYAEAVRIKPDFVEAYVNLGVVLTAQGRIAEAISQYSEAIRIKPSHEKAHYNLGIILAGQGRVEEAIVHYRDALRFKPDYVEAHNNLGVALAAQGKLAEAVAHYTEALRIRTDYYKAHFNLGLVLSGQGRQSEAVAHYSEALRLEPNLPEAHLQMGLALAAQGKIEEAVLQYREALRLRPGWPLAACKLAWILTTTENPKLRNATEGVQLASQACLVTGSAHPEPLDTLAAAYAEAGQFDKAVQTARKAVELSESAKQPEFSKAIQARLELYKEGRPFREGTPSPSP